VITRYYRPTTLAEAASLAARPDTAVLGGGTSVSVRGSTSAAAVVDLQAIGLSGISIDAGVVRIGATTTLHDVAKSDAIPIALRDLARREAPSIIRNAATIGGTIGVADSESPLLTGLLACGAEVSLATHDSTSALTLDEFLDGDAPDGAIITSVSLPAHGTMAAMATARTPMDRPIVLAVTHRDAGGVVRLAISGVADRPLIVDPARVGELTPPSDFRGSSAYRLSVASVLATRAMASVAGVSS
jgi:CO/xanthine dehydrogenase FAD-binding subunit